MVTQLIVGADHRGREKLQALCARLQEVFPDLKIEQPWHHEQADDHYNLAASQGATDGVWSPHLRIGARNVYAGQPIYRSPRN